MRQINSVQHRLVKHLVKVRKSRSYRESARSVFIEGKKMVREVGMTHRLKNVLVQHEDLLPKGVQCDEFYCVSEAVMQKLSGVKSPEGIAAEVVMPHEATLRGKYFVLALDGVSDPGNMGTLLRTALALGWQGVFLLQNSCDPYNDKALRAAKGATFRLPISGGTWEELERIVTENTLTPYVADVKGDNVATLNDCERILLVLSHEAKGVSPAAKKMCQPVTIPMKGKMESLNVGIAGGILMYMLRESYG